MFSQTDVRIWTPSEVLTRAMWIAWRELLGPPRVTLSKSRKEDVRTVLIAWREPGAPSRVMFAAQNFWRVCDVRAYYIRTEHRGPGTFSLQSACRQSVIRFSVPLFVFFVCGVVGAWRKEETL